MEVSPKWLPVIDAESCTGCGRCLEACDHGCLGMVWEFATLLRPGDCGGEGRCVKACREDLIRMDWVRADHAGWAGRFEQRPAPALELEEPARALLAAMLTSVRHSRDTPLYFGIDARGIVAAALDKTSFPSACEDQRRALVAMDRIVGEALGCGSAPRARGPETSPLVAWLGRVHRCMVAVHPLATDILSSRVEGETSREIALRLDLGLRLTERIGADMRAAWAAEVAP
jgi:NAD-dependent dihydropyrimidine dehydrogenase PreA subunit